MKIKVGNKIFDAAVTDICIMMTEKERMQIASMEPKDAPRFYGIYRYPNHEQFEADQEVLTNGT